MRTFISLRTKILVSYTVIFTIFFGGVSYWLYISTTHRTINLLKENLKLVAIASAQQIDTDELMALYQEGKPKEDGTSDDPRYEKQLQWLKNINQLHPQIFLFNFTHPNISDLSVGDQTNIIYLTDVWMLIDPRKSVKFLEVQPANDVYVKALVNGTVEFRDFHVDKWGSWITYYAPIKDSSGKVVAVMGADMKTSEVIAIQQEIKQRFLSLFIILYPLFFGLVYILTKFLTTHFQELQKYAEAIGEGNYQPDITISDKFHFFIFGDERTILAEVLQTMANKIKQREDLLNSIFNQVAVGVAIHDNNCKFSMVNQTLCFLLGYPEKELLNHQYLYFIHPEDIASMEEYLREVSFFSNSDSFSTEKRFIKKNGDIRWLEITTTFIGKKEEKSFVSIFQDTTNRRFAEEKLIEAANTDFLTKLPNRSYFMASLENLLKKIQDNPDYLFALLLVDLDNFKTINDSLGHLAGDKFLIDIAYTLRRCLSPDDIVARLGGDEFAILLTSIESMESAIAVAEKIQKEITMPFYIDNQPFLASASIGIVLSHNQTRNTPYLRGEDLFRDADIAMYQAKNKGKGDYEIFGREMYENFIKKLKLENELRKAIKEEELILFYQPIIDLSTGKLASIESLIRWNHPELGLLSPFKFLPIAEQSGLMIDLGKWVLKTACTQLKLWQENNIINQDVCINVNVAEQQFEGLNLLEEINNILSETGISAHNLRIEITETIIAHNISGINKILQRVKDLGVRIAIDDFGTGYSSLARLRSFPLEQIKIDKTFIKPLNIHPKNVKFLQGIINLCHNLDLKVVCEGVETEIQEKILKKLGCNYVQGYLFAKPMDSTDFEGWISDII